MVNKLGIVTLFVALASGDLACNMIDRARDTLAGGGDKSMSAHPQLWNDVPPMAGMNTSEQAEMPAWLKALTRPIMDGMMKGLNDGKDAGHWDWNGFILSGKMPADVQSFYTPQRMAGHGWRQGEAACMPLTEKALLCSFTKEASGKTTGLIIIAAADEQKKATSLFFLRAEGVEAAAATAQPKSVSPPLELSPIAPITIGTDLTAIDLCRAIPKENIEAVLGRKLVKAPERFNYYDTPASCGCAYEGQKDADGEAHYGYVALTPFDVYATQPLYMNVAVTGIGDEAYFNNGADTRQLWVKIDNKVAFVVAFGDVADEEHERAIAKLLVAAIR